MTAALTLACANDAEKLLDLMGRYHAEAELTYDDDHRALAVVPLLGDSPLGAVWLVGPARAPLGYVTMTFGWSIDKGGMTATLAEAFIRPSVRSRGIGTEALHAIMVQLSKAGIKAFLAAPQAEAARAIRFCERLRLYPDTRYCTMSDSAR